MFYNQIMAGMLRFGDVLKGYTLAASNIEEPNLNKNYKVDINLPLYCIVLTPCCSIGEKTISLSPLIKVRGSFFDNPYLNEDLRRINQKMLAEQSVSPNIWEKLPPEEKQKRLDVGYAYGFVDFFVYEKNDLFSRYTVNRKNAENVETNYYMIDFRNIYKLSCEKIITPKNSPLESKCLQLSIEARTELRDKIADYYARVPKEDEVLED